ELTGRKHGLFDYYGASDAENIIIAMGSITDVIEETIDYLNGSGEKYGLVKVHLYRPFSIKHLLKVIPKTVKKIAVLDRTKEPGAIGEPLYLDVKAAYYGIENAPLIVGGRFGLASKDTTPAHIKAVYDNLKQSSPKDRFTIGIVDDVTNTSLNINEHINATPKSTFKSLFWGLGSDGTVGANKQAIKIIGDHTDKYVQAYFAYDSKKSGGVTMSHLRFGDQPIKSAYLVHEADYIACHNQSYVNQYDLLKGIKTGGTFVLNCLWDEKELEEHLPAEIKRQIARNNVQFYTVNAYSIAENIGLGNRINMIMQAAFFKLANIIPLDDAVRYLKEGVVKTYGRKGENVVKINQEAIDKGINSVVKINVPEAWKDAQDTAQPTLDEPDFIKNMLRPINAMRGEDLPVSAFVELEDGTLPNGTSAYEKRGIAVNVPEWNHDTCIQCNICSLVCPHAVIRPVLATKEELADAPESFITKQAVGKGMEEYQFRIQISPMDCTGCGNCADVCPAKPKALVMKKLSTQTEHEIPNYDFATNKISYKGGNFGGKTIKDSQFRKPLMEFSGACAGCGETPYIKLVTQLFGDRMMIANATGCSSIWGASYPTSSYTVNNEGKGPAWANSLFEDNAEFGYGMYLGIKQIRERITDIALQLAGTDVDENLKTGLIAWTESVEDGAASKGASEELLEAIKAYTPKDQLQAQLIAELLEKQDYLVKRSVWIVGGDGWAYDIGYGGLDHVLASGDDVNVLVFDTEIYSNTGGQASKATPTSAIAKFASSGKKAAKKDLAAQMMTYGNVYVAQVGIGADRNQLLKAIAEAEAYKGPSIIIAYAPCISHGIKDGMGRSIANSADAVASGYWHLFRYNPDLKPEGKNPFSLDSKEPKSSFRDFLMNQVRYSSLAKQFPEEAEDLFSKAEEHAREKYAKLKKMAE
uniref:pyruvate:ferredoxin (flavodoxin) oxidoreductase n=1 Tax=Ruminiclostridium cellobioparum TaxID=29355 RepID=UPI0028AFFEB6